VATMDLNLEFLQRGKVVKGSPGGPIYRGGARRGCEVGLLGFRETG
jgi:hypothetical protein